MGTLSHMSIISNYSFTTTEGKTIKGELLRGYVALLVDESYWIVAKGYKLYKYYPEKRQIEYFSKLVDFKSFILSKNKLIRRLTRAEITKLYHFDNDEWFCIARKAIFRYNHQNRLFERCYTIKRGSRPLNLCQNKDGKIYFGEYFYNPSKGPVNIYCTPDNGKTWSTTYTFAEGEINHIHGIFNDSHTNKLWVFTGDDDSACIAGYTDDGFKTFHKVFYGSQKCRICVPIFKEKAIIYGTDSQYEPNYIRSVDRESGIITDITSIQGSCIYAMKLENLFLISTTVEPSDINKDNKSHLWYSFDGYKWYELFAFEKDCLKKTLFQFGSIRFPNYVSNSKYLVCTGRALKIIDQSTLIIPISDILIK